MATYSKEYLDSIGFTLPFHGWASKYVQKNIWRFHGTLDSEDLFQEVLIVFLRVKEKYQEVEPKHLMALFKVSVINEVNCLTLKYTATESDECLALMQDKDSGDLPFSVDLMQDASKEVKMLLRQLATDSKVLFRHGKLSEIAVREFFDFAENACPVKELKLLLKSRYNMHSNPAC